MVVQSVLSISRRCSPITSYVQRFQGFLFSKIKRIDTAVGTSRHKSHQTIQATEDELFAHLDVRQLAPKKRYPLRGIKYLPGSDGEEFPEFLAVPREGLPKAFKIQHADQLSLTEWAQHCRKLLDEELPKYGAVLFRGLPLTKGEHFSSFVKDLGYTSSGYEGGTGTRPVHDQKAYTFVSTDEPKRNNIEPHNEMSYWPTYPKKIMFFCDEEPPEGTGGLTPITKTSEVLARLDPKVVQKFEEKQIRYIRAHPTEGKGFIHTWQCTFNTKDRKEAERYLEGNNFFYKWNPDDSLFCWRILPPTIYHPITGEKLWFNQACTHHFSYWKLSPMYEGITFESDSQYPTTTAYGDGTEIEPEVIQHLRETKWKCTVGFEWKKSDMMILDNLQVMHSRLSYTGKRKILVYMTTD